MANAKDKISIRYSLAPNSLPETDGYHRVLSHVGSKDGSECSKVSPKSSLGRPPPVQNWCGVR